MSNDRYVQAWTGFSGNAALSSAPNVSEFNPAGGEGFLASVLFKIPGSALPLDTFRHALLGNAALGNVGWVITVGRSVSAGTPWVLSANVSEQVGPEYVLAYDVNGTVPAPQADYVERLILATAHYRFDEGGPVMDLYVNGNRVASLSQPVAYANSSNPLTIGNAFSGLRPAGAIEIVGAAFLSATLSVASASQLVAEHFRASRGNNMVGMLRGGVNILRDFSHRWNATGSPVLPLGDLEQAPNTAHEVFVYSQAVSLPVGRVVRDAGNRGYNEIPGVTDVPMVVVSGDLAVKTTANPDWYAGSMFIPPGDG